MVCNCKELFRLRNRPLEKLWRGGGGGGKAKKSSCKRKSWENIRTTSCDVKEEVKKNHKKIHAPLINRKKNSSNSGSSPPPPPPSLFQWSVPKFVLLFTGNRTVRLRKLIQIIITSINSLIAYHNLTIVSLVFDTT